MKVVITKGFSIRSGIFQRTCSRCKCVFEFEYSDIDSEFYDQREGCNFWYVSCPTCGDKTGIEQPKPIRY